MHSPQDLPSLSSSTSTSVESSPRTSTTTVYTNTLSHSRSLHTLKPSNDAKKKKRHHSCEEPVRIINNLLLIDNTKPISRWDDSQLEIELAEDDLIEKKVRRSSSLRLKLASDSIKEKFRNENKGSNKFTSKFKRLYDWLR